MLSDDLAKRVTMVEGIRPTAAAVPRPGTYWLKQTSCSFYWVDKAGTRLDHPTHNQIWSVWTWELQKTSDWFLADVGADGDYMVMGNDVDMTWEKRTAIITHVGPRVTPPEE